MGRILKRDAPPKTVLVGYTPNKLPPNLIVQKHVADPMVAKCVELGGICVKWEGFDPTADPFILLYQKEDDGKYHGYAMPFKPYLTWKKENK